MNYQSEYEKGALETIDMIADELQMLDDIQLCGIATSRELKEILAKVAAAKSPAFKARNKEIRRKLELN